MTWEHLPNAKHIDRILADLRLRPEAWSAAWSPNHGDTYNTAWDDVRNNVQAADRDVAWDGVWDAIGYVSYDAKDVAWDALLALIAWDDCAYILDLHPNVVRLMAASGNQPAILLEAAVIAMHEENV